MNKIFLLSLLIIINFPISSFAQISPNCKKIHQEISTSLPNETQQFLYLHSSKNSNATISACQKTSDNWAHIFSYPTIIGSNGIAALGTKQESDKKTPAGIYPLGHAFGTKPIALKLDFKYITPSDKFVDDVTSPEYNTWVEGDTDALSYEPMFVPEYKLGIIIKYNMNPIIKNQGSAIFMHIWLSHKTSTTGCIALKENELEKTIKWLEKDLKPYIYIKED